MAFIQVGNQLWLSPTHRPQLQSESTWLLLEQPDYCVIFTGIVSVRFKDLGLFVVHADCLQYICMWQEQERVIDYVDRELILTAIREAMT